MRQTKIAASSVLGLREIHLKPQSPSCGRQCKSLLQISDPGTDERQVVREQPVWWAGLQGEDNYAVTPLTQLAITGRNSVHHQRSTVGKVGKGDNQLVGGYGGCGWGGRGSLLEQKV